MEILLKHFHCGGIMSIINTKWHISLNWDIRWIQAVLNVFILETITKISNCRELPIVDGLSLTQLQWNIQYRYLKYMNDSFIFFIESVPFRFFLLNVNPFFIHINWSKLIKSGTVSYDNTGYFIMNCLYSNWRNYTKIRRFNSKHQNKIFFFKHGH